MTISDSFTATTEKNGKTLMFGSRRTTPDGVNEADFPHMINISWPYKSPDKSGMPDAQVSAQHLLFEQALAHLENHSSGHLMLTVVGNSKKEWFWYVKDVEKWLELMNTALADTPKYHLNISSTWQPDWMLYHAFISGIDKTEL